MTNVTTGEGPRWLGDFGQAVAAGDREGALALLEARATSHAGTPKAADKRAAAKAVLIDLREDAAQTLGWARWLADRSPTAKDLAAMLLVPAYPADPKGALSLLRRLADDAHWEVREWAGSSAGELLAHHFDEVLPQVQAWARDESQFVRRAVDLAARGAADRRRLERCEPLLQLMDALVTDRADEVRRNTGPFAVGGSLLAAYPEQTLARVRRWAANEDEMSRWNAAMVFTAANARKHVGPGLDVLSELARDQRRLVWMAVASALRHLVKRDPERVVPRLREWLKDDRKLPAAIALRQVKAG
jgi:3-methyladenine DNA glycosylase AlkC